MLALRGAFRAAAAPPRHPPLTNLIIFVTDFSTHKPVFQAQLTLQFPNPDSRLHKWTSYSAKTDLKGRYTFTFIPMGPIVLFVTDPNHQSYGGKLQVTETNQIIHVTLRRPQPLR
jgi:hypothetical protein